MMWGEKMPNSKCLICESQLKDCKLKGLLKCEGCNFITTNLNITDEELRNLYKREYFNGEAYGDYISDKKEIQKNFEARWKVLRKFIDSPINKNLFEIGCAYGFFLELMKDKFNVVSGIDISVDAINYARNELNLPVTSGDFLSYEMGRKFDVFCMWDTIEHLKNPHLFLEKISNNINKDGLLAITTGDIESLNAKIRGNKWRIIQPPHHLHYFSQKTLTQLMKNNGFEIVYVGYPGIYRSLRDAFYITLVLKNNMPKSYEILKRTGLTKLNCYLNTFDVMYIIGRKI